MQPAELRSSSFASYPPEARSLATSQLVLLQTIPLPLLPILLRELISYDWKLPAERQELNKQFAYLSSLPLPQRAAALKGFHDLSLNESLASFRWVDDPSGFVENLTAWLWSTQQMDHFRTLADSYANAVSSAVPSPAPAQGRLAIVVIGAGVERTAQPLFRKLRPHGVYLTGLHPGDGMAHILAEASRRSAAGNFSAGRAAADPTFLHWYIDGGAPTAAAGLTQISYASLEQPRTHLLERIDQAIGTGNMGPEELRSLLARLRPAEIGLDGQGPEAILNHFKLSLLTEGAGAQIFATTFVQWAARECIRRAQPETVVVRYTPRQQARTMNLMLSGAKPHGIDPEGSLIDADLGAYYAWLSMRRLTGSDQLRFLAWFEGHREAVAIAPGLPRGASSDSTLHLDQALALLT